MFRLLKSLFWLTVLFPVLGSCGDSAIAIASGNVRLNGNPLVRSSSVFPGDVMDTGGSSAVVVHSNGSTVQIWPSTECTVQEHALELLRGTARVSGPQRIRAGAASIVTTLKTGRFTVFVNAKIILVTANTGAVSIHVGKEVMILQAGQSVTFDKNGSPRPAANGRNKKKWAVAGIAGAGSAASLWIIASHLGEGQDCMSPPCRTGSKSQTGN